MNHTWDVDLRQYATAGTHLTMRHLNSAGVLVGSEVGLNGVDAEPILCAEIVRLAQEVEVWKRSDSLKAQKVQELEAEAERSKNREFLLTEGVNQRTIEARRYHSKNIELSTEIADLKERLAYLDQRLSGVRSERDAPRRERDAAHLSAVQTESDRDAYRITAEEGQQIIAELSVALAHLHGENLERCEPPCPGHLQPKARETVLKAGAQWGKLEAEARLGRELVSILIQHCGERGDSESAVETLSRIIRERGESRSEIARWKVTAESCSNRAAYLMARETKLQATVIELQSIVRDGIFNIQRAQESLGDFRGRQLADGWNERMATAALHQLDLAQQVLSQAVGRQSAEPKPSAHVAKTRSLILDGINRIEARLHRIEKSVADARSEGQEQS